MATATYFTMNGEYAPVRAYRVYVQAGVIANEADKATSFLDVYAGQFQGLWRAGQLLTRFVFCAWNARQCLNNVVVGQDRLIQLLNEVKDGEWPVEGVRVVLAMLNQTLQNERSIVSKRGEFSKPSLLIFGSKMDILAKQLDALEDIAEHLTARTIEVAALPGDSDCAEFMRSLSAPEEFDFSF